MLAAAAVAADCGGDGKHFIENRHLRLRGEREGWNLEMQNNAEMAAAAAEGHTHRYFLMADLMISGKTIGKLETEGAWNMLNSF